MYGSVFRVGKNVLRRLESGTIRLQVLGSPLMIAVSRLRLPIVLCCAVAILTGLATQVRAQTFGFDTPSSVTPGVRNFNPPPVGEAFDYGGFTPTLTATSSYAAGVESTFTNTPGSGSVKLSWSFDEADHGASSAFTFDIQPSPGAQASALSFDIMVAPGSTPDTFGGYGYFQVFTRDGSYNDNDTGYNQELANPGFGSPASPGTGVWQHITIPLSGAAATVRGITFQDYADGVGTPRPITGPETIYIDNISLTPVPEPASLVLIGLAIPALVVISKRRFPIAA
jgi:hypothetical protein